MATSREYLQSIIAQAARLQSLSDEKLDSISDGLARVDSDLDDALTYVEEQ